MESKSIPLFSYTMRFGSVLFGSVRLEYLSFGIRYFGILPASVHHWNIIIHRWPGPILSDYIQGVPLQMVELLANILNLAIISIHHIM